MEKIKFPKGATHARLTTPDGRSSTVNKEDADIAFNGVEGKITFLVKVGGTAKKPELNAMFGAIDNPLVKGAAPQAEVKTEVANKTDVKAAEVKAEAKTETKTDVKTEKTEVKAAAVAKPKEKATAKSKAVKPTKEPKPESRTGMIRRLMLEATKKDGVYTSKYTANQATALVLEAHPYKEHGKKESQRRAYGVVIGMGWNIAHEKGDHAGKKFRWASEVAFRKEEEKAAAAAKAAAAK